MLREYCVDQKVSSSIDIGTSFRVTLQSDMLSEIAFIATMAISRLLSATTSIGVQFMKLPTLWKEQLSISRKSAFILL